jgi:hypothetical protein
MGNIRLISKKDPLCWHSSPAAYVPSEDLMVISDYYILCKIAEKQIIDKITSVVNHESLERESFKLTGLTKSEFLNRINWIIEEWLGWIHGEG